MKIKENEYLPMTYLRSLLARKVMLQTWKQLKKVIVWQMQRQTYPLKIYCVVSTFLWLSSWQSTVLLILIYMASNEWKNPVHERGNQAFQPNWADPCTVSTVIITRQGFYLNRISKKYMETLYSTRKEKSYFSRILT